MPRILLTCTALLTAIVVAAGCGNDDSSSSSASSMAPAGSIVYAEASLAPEGDQKAAIESLVEKFPGEGPASQRIDKLLEDAFSDSDSDLSYDQDVKPWLGDEAAFFLTKVYPDGQDASGAVLVAAEDEEKADEMLAKIAKHEGGKAKGYKDEDYFTFDAGDSAGGVVDGWLVYGDPAGFKTVVDTAEGGDTIDDDEGYDKALQGAPEERLGFVYVDTPGILDQLQKSGGGAGLGQFEAFFKDPFVATFDADDAGVRLEATLPETFAAGFPVVAEGSDLAGELPADSWLAMAQPDLGKTIEQYLDLFAAEVGGRDTLEQQLKAGTGLDLQDDVISWMGDWSLFVRGTTLSDLSGALIIETSDEAASGRFITAAARLARQSADSGERVRPLELPGGGKGVTLHSADVPEPIHLFQRDGKVVLAYGGDAAKDAIDPGEKLSDSPDFAKAEKALGGDYALSFYLALDPVLALADSAGAAGDLDWEEAKPYLEPFGALVTGAREDGDKLRSAFGITVD